MARKTRTFSVENFHVCSTPILHCLFLVLLQSQVYIDLSPNLNEDGNYLTLSAEWMNEVDAVMYRRNPIGPV